MGCSGQTEATGSQLNTDEPPEVSSICILHVKVMFCMCSARAAFVCVQAEVDAQTWEEITAIANGTYDPRAVDAIVRDLMAEDEADEAELPRLARRNPVVAAAAVSGRK